MHRTCPACLARLAQQASTCPQCGANLAAGANLVTPASAVDQAVRNTAVAAHLSTFAGLVVPFGSSTRWPSGGPAATGTRSSMTPAAKR
jgi:hypothetical protein